MINCALSVLTSERFAGSGSGRRTGGLGKRGGRPAGRHEFLPGWVSSILGLLRPPVRLPEPFAGVRSGVLLIACWSRLPR